MPSGQVLDDLIYIILDYIPGGIFLKVIEKAKKMDEITRETLEEGHYKHVIAGMIDLETLKQTAEYQE